MKLHQLTANLSVSEQLNIDDIPAIVAAGIKTVICNRPDNEGQDQPASAALREACLAKDITWHYMPINPQLITDEQGMQFGELIKSTESPALAFCRSGTRCTNLWALSQAPDRSIEEILGLAKSAGYDISALSERLSRIADKKAT